jgi:hypothetical protein
LDAVDAVDAAVDDDGIDGWIISPRNCTTSFNRSNGAIIVLLIAPDTAPAAASTIESFIRSAVLLLLSRNLIVM